MYVIDVVKLSPFCAAPRFEYPNVPSGSKVKTRWLPPSRPLYAHSVLIKGRQPSGSVPNKPLPHDAVFALFQLTRICATLPAFTPVTVPYCELINVCWDTESYCFASKTCTIKAMR